MLEKNVSSEVVGWNVLKMSARLSLLIVMLIFIVAVINCHKSSSLQQHEFTVVQSWRSKA